MTSTSELAGSLGMKSAMAALDNLMRDQGVEAPTREAIINASEMMYQYIPYAIEQGKKPTDGKVLAEFLTQKTGKSLKFFGNDSINCGVALVEFLMSANTAYGSTASGIPPAITLAYGLALLDLIEVGNSCEFAQQAYYEAFQKESDIKIRPLKTRVDQYYSKEKAMCVMPPATDMSHGPY